MATKFSKINHNDMTSIFLESFDYEKKEKILKNTAKMLKYFISVYDSVKGDDVGDDFYFESLLLASLTFTESIILEMKLNKNEVKEVLFLLNTSILAKQKTMKDMGYD